MTRRTALAALAACAVLGGAVVSGFSRTTPQAPYRSRTDLVSVYATVTDAEGRLVPGLAAEDFEVRDNGKRQTLGFFSNEPQPITIVVMLDRSGSMEDNFPLVEEAAGQFVRKLLPVDRARIGNFSRHILILPTEFTSDQDALLRVLRHDLQQVGPSPVWTAVDRGLSVLAEEAGRRVILLFSDGHDDPRPGQRVVELDEVMRRAEAEEVMVYTIGLADDGASLSSWGVHNWIGQIQLGERPKRKVVKPHKGLREIAERTGGGYFELGWDQDLGAVFARVADELHRQYTLGFTPAELDGKTHELEVKLKRRGLTVRARKSYVAEAP
jgi:VWFA-related protein